MKLLTTLLFAAAALPAMAQGTAADYQRAFSVRSRYAGKVLHSGLRPEPVYGTHQFRYHDGDSLYIADADKRAHYQIPTPPKKKHEGHGPGAPGRHWMVVPDEKDQQGDIGYKDGNLTFRGRQLTTDGNDSIYYSTYGSFSPDSTWYATLLITKAPRRFVHYCNSSPKDQLQPKYFTQEYAKPGDSLDYHVPVLIELATGRVVKPSTELFRSQYLVTPPQWDENGRTLTFEFNERGHKIYRVLELDLQGNVRTLIEEKNDKYVAYSRNLRRDLDANHILWKSDRSGMANLYILDRRSGKLRQITNNVGWVRDVVMDSIDKKGRGFIIFTANGQPSKVKEDPYFIRYYRVGLDGKGLRCLTPESATHSAAFSYDGNYFTDTYSTVQIPPVTLVRDGRTGAVVDTLAVADISQLKAAGWTAPEVFTAPGRDGKTEMWGLIRRPSNFDPAKTYPVVEYIYSGPGDQYVPKSFSPWLWTMDDLAELGFIVVQLDAMGTSFRSLDFEQTCYKNLKDAGFPDRIAWIKAAAKQYPQMDISRMGIFGCSAGGQEALGALLFHGDFYKAGYAACGCHDNRMDKIWWNEQWMGYPVDSSYVECSNRENAWRLQGKLMLVVGELDDNVDPSSSFQVVDALIRAKKDFEFIYLPGEHHTMGGEYGDHKRYDFFVRNLIGKEPPAWSATTKN